MDEYLNQNDDGSFRHFTFKVRLLGDTKAAREHLKVAEADLFALRREMMLSGVAQQYRELVPAPGVTVNLSIVGMLRIIEIYAPPIEGEKKETKERPCFCNCCFSECQIARVDGTWRSDAHPDVPLPYLGYTHGDRRLRYDIDVCSFVGLDPTSGLTAHEFYRVENVMASDFTPYEVGDWALVYFTDGARGEKCGECEDCEPPELDEYGLINGCGPRDVMIWMNLPQCIIMPITFTDRVSRGTLLKRNVDSFRKGVCVKPAILDWVQYSRRDEEDRPVPGYANVRWDAWPEVPGGMVVDNIPIHYCTQDFNNEDGSHAFRWSNEVYLLMEGDDWTVLGHTIATMPEYPLDAPYLDLPVIMPALLLVKMHTETISTDFSNWEGGGPYDTQAAMAYIWDFTHDKRLDFTQYSWAEDDLVQPANPDDADRYLAAYFFRISGEPRTYSSTYGWPSSALSIFHTKDTFSNYPLGACSTHTHESVSYITFTPTMYTSYFGIGRRDSESHTDGYSVPTWGKSVGTNSEATPATYSLDGGEAEWTSGEFFVFLGGGDVFNPLSDQLGWSRVKHVSGYLANLTNGAWADQAWYNCTQLVELGTSTSISGITVNLDGFASEHDRHWKGFVSKAFVDEDFSVTAATTSVNFTWEYLDLFYGREEDEYSVFTGSLSSSFGTSGGSGSSHNAEGVTGLLLANTSSLTVKVVEARYDVVDTAVTRAYSVTPKSIDDTLYAIGTQGLPEVTATRVDGETKRHVRIEIGGSYSRSDDPFPEDESGARYTIYDKPHLAADLDAAIKSVPMRMQETRDDRLANGHASAWVMAYRDTYSYEDRIKINII